MFCYVINVDVIIDNDIIIRTIFYYSYRCVCHIFVEVGVHVSFLVTVVVSITVFGCVANG